MNHLESPFLAVPACDWICSDDLAFAIFDGFPVSPGHVLVTTRRIVETWFDATDDEQAALMSLVKETKRLLDIQLTPKPDGYNVGFNSGGAAGQTVPHVHIHVIPRYLGDMPDPRGGVRHVIPGKGNYLADKTQNSVENHSLTLATGKPHSPLWKNIGQRVSSAVEVDLLAPFIQPSGLDLIQLSISSALRAGAKIKTGMFIARVRGHSMEPKIADGSWNLFRPCPQGSREGRIVLVQFNSRGDLEDVGRITVKKYHSAKTVKEDGWKHEHIELLPLNPDYNTIIVAPHEGTEMVVVGEWVSSID